MAAWAEMTLATRITDTAPTMTTTSQRKAETSDWSGLPSATLRIRIR